MSYGGRVAPALANKSHFPGGGVTELLPESERAFPEAFWLAATLSDPRPHLLGPCQMSCPALAYRIAGSSLRCRLSISSNTHALRSRWRSWVPGDLSLEQRELKKEKRENSPEELYVQEGDGVATSWFFVLFYVYGCSVCLCVYVLYARLVP